MKATEILATQIETSKGMVVPLLEDLADAPLTFPTANGGNHPLWIAGHLVFSEGSLAGPLMFGTPHPLGEWKDAFGRGSEPTDDASQYAVTIPEVIAKWDEIRENTLAQLAKLTDDDLDKPTAECPPGREAFFGTYGKALSAVAFHPYMHRGQLADARKALGRPPLMG